MKKALFILALVLTMVSSLVAGTLAMYTTTIDNLASGSVTAKEFIFTSAGTDSFRQGIKIAPSETVQWHFKVKNYEDNIVTETDLYYRLTFNIRPTENKSAIEPLTVTVKDLEGRILNSVTGTGTFDVLGSFMLSETGQEKDYIVEIHWPGNGSEDIKYAGNKYGTSITVDALASQSPLSGNTEPGGNGIIVRYETTAPWQNGQSGIDEFAYKVTITNNTDTVIKDWSIEFSLPNERLVSVWSNARYVQGLPEGSYKFITPAYNNPKTDDILPGRSVTFGGLALGLGKEAIENIIVDGSNVNPINDVELICEFGKNSL
jgi:hypothetical protein